MKILPLALLVAIALITIQCSPLREGIVVTEQGRSLSRDAFSIALISDIPYSDRQVALLDELIAEVNADPSVSVVMHAGDIKGSAPCDDALYLERFRQFQQFQRAFIFTPGDNEWADCHREDNGHYHPLERLDFVRKVFFANPSQSTGGRPIPVRSQSTVPGFERFVENVVFMEKGIVFGTVHVVGGNNNLRPWSGLDASDSFSEPRPDRLEEFRAREEAAIQWLNEIFRLAHDTESPGVLILIQADPRFGLDRDDKRRAGFNRFIDRLEALTVQYGGPVLLAHGHWHYLWVDKPLHRISADGIREHVTTLTRIQIPGSPFVRWVKVTIDPQSSEIFLLRHPFIHKHDSIPW